VLDSIGQSDVVYSTWLYPDGVAVANAAASVGVASWIMVMGSDTFHLQVPARRRAILDACEKAEGLICVCRTLANRLIEAGVAAGKVHVVPNGVDSSVFHHRDKERAANELPSEVTDPKWLCPVLDGSAQLVLFVANLVPVKAPDVMIESFVELQDALGSMRDHKPVHLLFIGDGPMRSKIQAEVRNGGLEENVHFIGKRPHKEVALWMNVADCLCLCSSNEGMPNAVLEALASGLPVAATDVGACREMLEQEQYGRVSPVNDPGAMASLLGEILNMDTDRATMAARHGKRDWSDQAMDILSLLGE
jgi:glycosyltransferase involved in cell wall biosynthesis